MENFWDFKVWGVVNLFAVLLMSLLCANILKRRIKFFKYSLIPNSVLGGAILLIIAGIYKLVTGDVMFNAKFFGGDGIATLEIITYHALALGFIASTFKASKGKLSKNRTVEIFNTGVTTVSTYLIQAVVGLVVTIIAAKVLTGFFAAAGIILPFGFGQGPGQALNYGTIYETDHGFTNGASFGLIIASIGFLCASIGGVFHLNILKRKKKIIISGEDSNEIINAEEIQSKNEIPMQGSIDKITIQIAFVFLAYFVAYLIMVLLGNLIPSMKSVIYGFNFLIGVLSATLVKLVLKLLQNAKIVKKEYTNDFLMTRISNLFYDIMVVASIAAIRLGILKDYWGIVVILAVLGMVVTYIYNLYVAKTLFKDYADEQFLTMYGMLTGTASTGVILLREIDKNFKTPASDNLVYQNFPAIVFGFPIMLLAKLAPERPILTLIILFGLLIIMNIILFRSKIFKKKK